MLHGNGTIGYDTGAHTLSAHKTSTACQESITRNSNDSIPSTLSDDTAYSLRYWFYQGPRPKPNSSKGTEPSGTKEIQGKKYSGFGGLKAGLFQTTFKEEKYRLIYGNYWKCKRQQPSGWSEIRIGWKCKRHLTCSVVTERYYMYFGSCDHVRRPTRGRAVRRSLV